MTANKLRGVIAAGAMIAGILMPMSAYAADDDVTITLTGRSKCGSKDQAGQRRGDQDDRSKAG